MPIKVDLHIRKGVMPRHGLVNKPLQLLLDDQIVPRLDWGDKRSFRLPAGKHTLTLKTKQGASNTLTVDAADGETLAIRGFLDTKHGGLFLIHEAEAKSWVNPLLANPKAYAELKQKRRAVSDERVMGICAFVGGATFFVLNVTGAFLPDFPHVPGGFLGGALGALIGTIVGGIINFLRRKSASSS